MNFEDLQKSWQCQHAGAKVTIETAGGKQYREIAIGNGFAGGSSRRIHFGLGMAQKIDAVTIRWPDGSEQRIGPVEPNQIVTIEQQRKASISVAK